jgi:hypothetical protein
MLNIRMVLLSAVVLLVLGLTARLVTAGTEVVSDPSSDPARVINNQAPSASQNKAPIPSYRSPLDECFDVPLREAASCRNASQVLIPSYRSPLDECYDVPLREANSCRNASRPPIPLYRSPLDECYDVPLREAASCRNASKAPVP